MAKKSDKRRERRISATEASRTFSHLLDEVEKGQRYLVERHGRDACIIVPAPGHGRRASECLALLRARSPAFLDGRFGADLLEVLGAEPVEERPGWGS